MGPPYARQYLLNFARLIITTGLTIGLFGAAVILLAGRLPGLLGKFLFVIAALSPVLICVWGFEKKPLTGGGADGTADRHRLLFLWDALGSRLDGGCPLVGRPFDRPE